MTNDKVMKSDYLKMCVIGLGYRKDKFAGIYTSLRSNPIQICMYPMPVCSASLFPPTNPFISFCGYVPIHNLQNEHKRKEWHTHKNFVSMSSGRQNNTEEYQCNSIKQKAKYNTAGICKN